MIATQGIYYIETAVESLKAAGDLDIELNLNADKEIDGFMTLFNQIYPIEAKKEFRLTQIAELKHLKNAYPNLILIADILSDNTKKALKANNINYLDTVGNAYIQQQAGLIWLNSQKRIPKPELNKDKAFTKKGLTVVFHLLNDVTLLNKPYRHISAITGASLDTITKVILSLRQQGFVRQKDKKTMYLTDKKRLFEKWADNYENRLKPSLFISSFRFLNIEAERNWHNLLLKETSIWGGEPAADILTDFLRPEIFTLYSTEKKSEIMRNYRLAPDPQGNIKVYMPFFTIDTSKTLYPLLVYADMLNSGIARNIEVAERIYEKHVKNILE